MVVLRFKSDPSLPDAVFFHTKSIVTEIFEPYFLLIAMNKYSLQQLSSLKAC